MKTLRDRRKIERESTPRPLAFDKFYERMAENMRKLNQGEAKKLVDDIELRDALVIESKHEPTSLTARSALIRAAELEQSLWMKRRKKELKGGDVSDCISALFELMDTKKVCSIEGLEFVSQLLGLGLSSDPRTLVSLLEASFGEDISTLQLTKTDLLKFCKGTRRSDYILARLTQLVQEDLQNTEVVPALRDYVALTRRLWGEMEQDIRGLTRKEQVENKLAELRMVPDLFEAKKLLKEAPAWFGFEDFSALFARSILKGALIELEGQLGKLNPSTGNCSTALRMSTFKRRLLLAGLNSGQRNLRSHEQGATALKALDQLHRMQTSPPKLRKLRL